MADEKILSDADADRARCVAVCMDVAGMLVDAGDCKGAEGARMCAEMLERLTPMPAACAAELERLRESNARLRAAVEHGESVYHELARAAGFDHEPPPNERVCIAAVVLMRAGVERLRADRDALRTVIAGRTTPPTGAEIDAHQGAFMWLRMDRDEAIASTRDGCEREAFDCLAFGIVWFREDLYDELPRAVGARWWPLDASGAPCAWPVVP